LRQRDIPAGRQGLREQHDNLHRVAEYCESNYLQASDKRKALEETMALSTQSLASVTYQVSSLATAFLRLLDLQAAQLRQVEADVTCVAQRVDIHKEKVSRREIGSLTVTKRFPPYQKIVAPPNPPSLEPYYRKPLNFSVLDDIGHGIKVSPGQEGVPRGWGGSGGLIRHPEGRFFPHSPFPSPGRHPREGVRSPPTPVEPFPAPEGTHGRVFRGPSGTGEVVTPGPRFPRWLVPQGTGGLRVTPAPSSPSSLARLGGFTAPTELELPPPPLALPDFEDLAPLPPPPASEEPSWVPENYLEKVVALYPYTRQKDNELSFQPGALLFITRRYSDGWCEGVLGQEAGFFPGNYVEPC
ncbi:ABI3 protein, partial [Tyrannus savana]|nr:ABI3 protein [Tyrannus savana]